MALALELARGVLEAQPSLTVESLAEKLSGAAPGWAELHKYRDALPSGNAKNVAAVLRLSWNAIAEEDARDVLQAMPVLAPEPVPLRVLEHLPGFTGEEGKEDLRLAVDVLVSLSLLGRVQGRGRGVSTGTPPDAAVCASGGGPRVPAGGARG